MDFYLPLCFAYNRQFKRLPPKAIIQLMAHPDRGESLPLIFPSSPEEPAPSGNRRRNSLPSSFGDDGADTNPNISSVLAPHPSTMRQPEGTLAKYIRVIRSWEAYIFTDSPLRSPFSSQASSVSTPIPALFAYSQASPTPPATGAPTHPYVLHSSPTPGPAHHQATTGLRSIPASFAPALSQGSPTPASQTREFLLQAPPAMPTELTIVSAAPTGSSVTPAAPIFLPTILTNTNPTAPSRNTAAPPAAPTIPAAFLPSILTNTNPINALAPLVVYVSSDSESESRPIPHAPRLAGYRSASARLAQDGSTGPIGPFAAATASPTIATSPCRIDFVADSDSEDYAIKTPLVARLPRYPSASLHFSRGGRSTHTNTAMPTNTATPGPGGSAPPRPSSLIVEPDSEELRCSDDGDYVDVDTVLSQ